VNSRIPRRIIQIWGGGAELPLLARSAMTNLRLLNPDFEYLLFDDNKMEEFIKDNFPEYRSLFRSFRFHIQRYDFFRYLAVYRLGGFYFDTDVFLASNLSELLSSACVFPFEALTINPLLREEYKMDWEVGNYAFGAVAGHPFLRAIIENCVKAQENPNWAYEMVKSIPLMFRQEYYVIYSTGPWLVSRTLAEFPHADKNVNVLFPEDVCDQEYWNRFGNFGVHLMAGSWRRKNGYFKRRLQRYWESFILNRLIRTSRKLGKNRSLQFK
jgi:hypothetical protein